MESDKLTEYKFLIPKIKTRAKALKNKNNKKIQRVNLALDPALTLISLNECFSNQTFKKENVYKIKEFLENIVLEQAKIEFDGNKCNYKALFSSFRSLVMEQLNLIEGTLAKLNAKTSGFAGKFFDEFGDGSLNDDGKFLESLRQLVIAFAQKNTATSDNELFDKMKQYLDKEKNEVFEKLKIINTNISKEPTQSTSSKFSNSLILNSEEHDMVSGWIKDQVGTFKTFKPLFNSKDHGFGAQTFHNKCDGQGPTIVFVETTAGKRFGGYANSLWHYRNGEHITDEKCFIFSVDLKEKYLHNPGAKNSMSIYSNYGPAFGSGTDIAICDNCNKINGSFFNANRTYNCRSRTGQDIAGVSQNDNSFSVKRIEVYKVIQAGINQQKSQKII